MTQGLLKKIYTCVTNHFKRKKLQTETEESLYYTLTPPIVNIHNDDLKEIEKERFNKYFSALNSALKLNSTKNIAITGPYGAGKSTLILSYLEEHYKNEYINISLADFDITGKTEKENSTNTEIEFSILQQILYKKDKSNLPSSRIDRIQNKNFKYILRIFGMALLCITPILLLIASIYIDKINSFYNNSLNLQEIKAWVKYPSSIYFSIQLILILLSLFNIFFVATKIGIFDKKIKLNKLAFLNFDASIESQNGPSLLNNCLDEIIYFFISTKFKFVVFEDLDRLNNSEIFIKLREINQIINNQSNKKNDPVRFIYAIKDEIFLDVDSRTKFFDFILPIIPILDSSNAYSLLIDKLKNFPSTEYKLLKQLSIYIKDMRVLLNIVNEYNLFCLISGNKSNNETALAKTFALVFYKNLYSLDYNLIDKKTGILYSIINDYGLKTLHEIYFGDLDNKLLRLTKKLEAIQKEKASTDFDIRKEIVIKFIPEHLWKTFDFEKQYHTFFKAHDLVQDESLFKDFFSTNKNTYIINQRWNERHDIDIQNIIEEYENRYELITTDKDDSYKYVSEQIKSTKEEINVKNSITLDRLIQYLGKKKLIEIINTYIRNIDDKEILTNEQLKSIALNLNNEGLDLLYYLLSNGYIMKDYMKYRSIFHDGVISSNDNDYIRSVGEFTSFKDANDTFSLDKPNEVFDEIISLDYLFRDSVFHYQIIEYLIDKSDSHLKQMIQMLFTKSDDVILLVYKTLKTKFTSPSYFEKFITESLNNSIAINKINSVLNNNLLNEDELNNNEIIKTITAYMLALIEPSLIKESIDYTYIENRYGYKLISILDDNSANSLMNINNFLKNTKELNITYEILSSPITDIEFNAVIFIANNWMFNINLDNYNVAVATLLREKNIPLSVISERPFSLLEEYELNNLLKFVNYDINNFVENVLLNSNEKVDSIKTIIKNTQLIEELKIKITEKLKFKFDDIADIENFDIEGEEVPFSFFDILFSYERVAPNWKNLVTYMNADSHHNLITTHLNIYAKDFSNKKNDSLIKENFPIIYEKIICNDDIEEEAYEQILSSLAIDTDSLNSLLSAQNMERIIKNNKLYLNEQSYEKILALFNPITDEINSECLINWFSLYGSEFTSKHEYYLRHEQNDNDFKRLFSSLLNSTKFSDQFKSNLLINYYLSAINLLKDIHVPRNILLEAINNSDNDQFKIEMIIKLLNNGFTNKKDLINLFNKLDEKELRKIFEFKTQATLVIQNAKIYNNLFITLKSHHLIKKFEYIGINQIKVYVKNKELHNN